MLTGNHKIVMEISYKLSLFISSKTRIVKRQLVFSQVDSLFKKDFLKKKCTIQFYTDLY